MKIQNDRMYEHNKNISNGDVQRNAGLYHKKYHRKAKINELASQLQKLTINNR